MIEAEPKAKGAREPGTNRGTTRVRQKQLGALGPFSLIYADPPWKWGHFGERDKENERGKGRTPDQHYPTLTYDTGMGLVFRNRHELLLYGTRGP